MRSPVCGNCELEGFSGANVEPKGYFFRQSDSEFVRRYRCLRCKKSFSQATLHPCYRQKKRTKNHLLKLLLVSGVSQRRAAKILRLNRKTVVRKFLFLSLQAAFELRVENLKLPRSGAIAFDDLETFEHTKCKPLSVTIAVEQKTRRILGLEVSPMPANGPLAERSRKKYGRRKDERRRGREKLFGLLQELVSPHCEIRSDQNPYYPGTVKKFFPKALHLQFKGRRPTATGHGELKQGGFDPLFDLNHTCAMFRANVNRLVRKTWCTTKKADRLYDHMVLYAAFHNAELI